MGKVNKKPRKTKTKRKGRIVKVRVRHGCFYFKAGKHPVKQPVKQLVVQHVIVDINDIFPKSTENPTLVEKCKDNCEGDCCNPRGNLMLDISD